MSVIEVLTSLYHSNISWRISCIHDIGYEVELGDTIRGFKSETSICDTVSEAIEWLAWIAAEYYPNSDFAKAYRGGKL